ncbi:MAG: ribosomal RNA small subunit methyltransferase A [Deltaproteobacteria bacterium]|nr:ribosomal RNA small subunit methyltransferase A [Deltaproteobacteria bacterium]
MKKAPRAKDQLRDLDVRPSKERGQNFIIDPNVLHDIVQFGRPSAEDSIVEIGPGLGALTGELARFPQLTLLEIEEKFCAELKNKFPHAKIVCADVREVDFSQLGSSLLVFGNLPYSFSTDIIFHLVSHAKSVKRAVLMLQREFAERVASGPGGREYGSISINAQLVADMRLGPIIPGTAFHPIANVDSRLIELTFLERPRVEIEDLPWFKKVVKAAFLQRRRKLCNSLTASCIVPGEQVSAALQAAGIDEGRRAETLSIPEFARLAEELRKHRA